MNKLSSSIHSMDEFPMPQVMLTSTGPTEPTEHSQSTQKKPDDEQEIAEEKKLNSGKFQRNLARGLRSTIIKQLCNMSPEELDKLHILDERMQDVLDFDIFQKIVKMDLFVLEKDSVEKIKAGKTNYIEMLGVDMTMQLYFIALNIQYASIISDPIAFKKRVIDQSEEIDTILNESDKISMENNLEFSENLQSTPHIKPTTPHIKPTLSHKLDKKQPGIEEYEINSSGNEIPKCEIDGQNSIKVIHFKDVKTNDVYADSNNNNQEIEKYSLAIEKYSQAIKKNDNEEESDLDDYDQTKHPLDDGVLIEFYKNLDEKIENQDSSLGFKRADLSKKTKIVELDGKGKSIIPKPNQATQVSVFTFFSYYCILLNTQIGTFGFSIVKKK